MVSIEYCDICGKESWKDIRFYINEEKQEVLDLCEEHYDMVKRFIKGLRKEKSNKEARKR